MDRYGSLILEPREIVDSGWIHAYGVYYPRRLAKEHQHSDWSRAVILAKRRAFEVIDRFAAMIAGRLGPLMSGTEPYVVTHVPAEPEPVQYLFDAFGRGAPDLLAENIHRHLSPRGNVRLATLITETDEAASVLRHGGTAGQCEGPLCRDGCRSGGGAACHPCG